MKGIERLLPFERDGLSLAGGMQAGEWVFASGLSGTAVIDPQRPLSGEPAAYLEARSMYARARDVLAAGGLGFDRVVRADQFFDDWRAVPFFHEARREACGKHVAPSTSILAPLGRGMSMDLLATRNKVTAVFPEGLEVPSTSSFVPVCRAGDFVFVAGFLAAHGEGDLGGIAPQARVPEGHLWKGNRIQLEADYIIRTKLEPALRGAGCTLANVVKANVFLADIHDVPAFNKVWRKHFGERIPPTAFLPTRIPGFAIADARCEINLVAYKGRSAAVPVRGRPACDGHPVAMRAGDLILTSGFLERPMDVLAELGGPERALRIQIAYTEEAEFQAGCRELQRCVGVPLPISGVRVPAPLVIPSHNLQFDCWIYGEA